MSHSAGVGKLAALLAGALCAGVALAAEPPDFTGVWTNAGPAGDRRCKDGRTATAAATRSPRPRRASMPTRSWWPRAGDSPGGVCLGTGMPGSMLGSGGYPMEIIQRPEQITVIYEAHTEVRRFYFGARNAAQADRVPGRNGYSIGALGRRYAGRRDRQPRRPGRPAQYIAFGPGDDRRALPARRQGRAGPAHPGGGNDHDRSRCSIPSR